MMPNDWIRAATRFRYSLPILAILHRHQGVKYIFLVRRLAASDRAIRQALDYLIEVGWVGRNPGYGHPSRPEYIVAPAGKEAAIVAHSVWSELSAWSNEEVAMERWPLLVLASIFNGKHRFAQISKDIGATPRAVAMALQRLHTAGLIERKILGGYPPSTLYEPTQWGAGLLSQVGESQSQDDPSLPDSPGSV
jgi:DNA-binding HxlR family transcriptional regulator